MFCCTLLYVHSSIAIILMGKRELSALLNLSSWCLVMVERLFLAVPQGCLQFVIVVFPDHTHLLFFMKMIKHRLYNLERNQLQPTHSCQQSVHPQFGQGPYGGFLGAQNPYFGASLFQNPYISLGGSLNYDGIPNSHTPYVLLTSLASHIMLYIRANN